MSKKTENDPLKTDAAQAAAAHLDVPQADTTGETAAKLDSTGDDPFGATPTESTAPVTKGATVTYLPFATPHPSKDESDIPGKDDQEKRNADRLAKSMRKGGSVALNGDTLRTLRQQKLFSQQDLADEFWRRNVRVSIATIKRAECGHAVRFRIARELALYFGVAVFTLLST